MVFLVKIPNRRRSPEMGEDVVREGGEVQQQTAPPDVQPIAASSSQPQSTPAPPLSPSAHFYSSAREPRSRSESTEPDSSQGPSSSHGAEDEAIDAFGTLSLGSQGERQDLEPQADSNLDIVQEAEQVVQPAQSSIAQDISISHEAGDAVPPLTSVGAEQPILSNEQATTSSTIEKTSAPSLDIIVAPAVLAHRYVRGTDVSLIVERPERIRALLLGVASILGRIGTGEWQDGNMKQSKPSDASDADSLVDLLGGMSVGGSDSKAAGQSSTLPIQVLHSTKSIPLHPAHPALAVVHAGEDEMVDAVLPECEQKRRTRQQSKSVKMEQNGSEGSPLQYKSKDSQKTEVAEGNSDRPSLYSSYLRQLCSYAPHAAPTPRPRPPRGAARKTVSATATPTGMGRTRGATARGTTPGPHQPAAAAKAPVSGATAMGGVKEEEESTSHDNGMAHGPTTPKNEEDRRLPVTPATVQPGKLVADSSSSSSEGEGHTHHSEIPYHLSQGDLYLRGTKQSTASFDGSDDPSTYGSKEAIEHALAASIEAVDRVVAASNVNGGVSRAASSSSSGAIAPLVFPSSSSSSSATALPSRRAFVLTRPPGHHCSASVPSGFCWVNNVAVAAVHAYQAHGIDRVIIFDIDLHHGNGTQKVAWKINEETRRTDRERDARLASLRATFAQKDGTRRGGRKSGGASATTALQDEEAKLPPRGLQIYYSSLHDIESYPCEDGDADLVRDASVTLDGAHGQWIQNVHLDKYTSPEEFDQLYREKYHPALFGKARRFLQATDARPGKTLILISAGFDACSYELPGMQRHEKHCPPGLYRRFGLDAIALADEVASGRCISLLEGGYGDRALLSAGIAHLMGLAGVGKTSPPQRRDTSDASRTQSHSAAGLPANDPYPHEWYSLESLKVLEKMLSSTYPLNSGAGGYLPTSTTATPIAKGGRGGAAHKTATGNVIPTPPWVQATKEYFGAFETLCEPLMRGFGKKAGARRR